ncbi:MAG TPA: glycosyltransferase, partial [Nocardioides sp.]|nr:glycosyltransferase [Nocardioides sp.]
MPDIVLVLLLLAAAAVPFWLLRDLRTLPDAFPGGEGRTVSVVVPARDEERTLPALLASLAGLPLREVVVVDDDSGDRTSAVAVAGGARVLGAPARPDGWTGKAWACHTGAESSTGDLLLFLDADTGLSPGAVDGLLRLHDVHGGLVS